MTNAQKLSRLLETFPRAKMAHVPTPIETLPNLSRAIGCNVSVKRDDCTGIGFGGNKVRQLEFYMGAAQAAGADTVLITGAVQSNFVRTAAAMAGRLGLECHIQLEERVDGVDTLYRNNGNVLLDRLLGATLHSFATGEDEQAADRQLREIAKDLRQQGRAPYVIPLGADNPPIGALGYVAAAIELAEQLSETSTSFDEIIIASGSALTHVGLLFGLRALGISIPVRGICVRRDAEAQRARVIKRTHDLIELTGLDPSIPDSDIRLHDGTLAPGYGKLNDHVLEAIQLCARHEGLFVDPAYTGKVMAGLIQLCRSDELAGDTVLFWHTGGQPALFAYAEQLTAAMEHQR